MSHPSHSPTSIVGAPESRTTRGGRAPILERAVAEDGAKLSKVQEVAGLQALQPIARVPRTPPFLRRMTDLRERFAVEPSAALALGGLLLLGAAAAPRGMVAQQPVTVATREAPAAAPAPAPGERADVAALSPVGFRPGLSEGTGITPRGRLVVEVGASVQGADTDGSRVARAGEVVLHVPVARRAELRVGLPSYAWLHASGARAVQGTGVGGAALAVRLADGAGNPSWRAPIVALALGTAVPMGSMPGLDRAWQPIGKLLLEVPASPSVTVMANAGVRRAGGPADRYAQPFASAWVHRRVGDHAGGYVEALVAHQPARVGPAQATTHAGLTYRLTADHHLDVHAGRTVRGGRAAFGGVGLMTRF